MRSVSSNVLGVMLVTAVAMSAAGCSSNYLGKVNMRSIGSDERLVLYRNRLDGSPIVCAEPNPDELEQQAAILAVKADGATSPDGAATMLAPASAVQDPKSLETIGLHSTSIQLMREGYYRLCEGLINGAITETEYQDSIKRIDASVAGYMAILFGETKGAPALPAAAPAVAAVAVASETDKPRVKKPKPAPAEPSPAVIAASAKPTAPNVASDFSVFDGMSAGQVTWPQWPCRVGCSAPPGWVGAEGDPAEVGRPLRTATRG